MTAFFVCDTIYLRKRKRKGLKFEVVVLLFNKNKFKASVIEVGLTICDIAKFLSINPATLYRKMNGTSDFTLNEIQMIKSKLSLDMEKVKEIFFA